MKHDFCTVHAHLKLTCTGNFSAAPERNLLKGPIRFCHSARKTKSLKFYLLLKEGILCRLKNNRGSSTTNKHMRISSLCQMPSFNHKSDVKDFVFSLKWQNLIRPLKLCLLQTTFSICILQYRICALFVHVRGSRAQAISHFTFAWISISCWPVRMTWSHWQSTHMVK